MDAAMRFFSSSYFCLIWILAVVIWVLSRPLDSEARSPLLAIFCSSFSRSFSADCSISSTFFNDSNFSFCILAKSSLTSLTFLLEFAPTLAIFSENSRSESPPNFQHLIHLCVLQYLLFSMTRALFVLFVCSFARGLERRTEGKGWVEIRIRFKTDFVLGVSGKQNWKTRGRHLYHW